MKAELRELSIKEAHKIYKLHMKTDFPPDELKPFPIIKRHMRAERYICFEATSGGLPCAYAYILKSKDGKYLLLDYFAVYKELRGAGCGSMALAAVMEWASENKMTLILESEDADYSKNDSDLKTRVRRIAFYTRNGMILSPVKTLLAGVHYRLLTYPEADAEAAIRSVYETMFPKRILEKWLHIKGERQ